jgi:hypothetical protein
MNDDTIIALSQLSSQYVALQVKLQSLLREGRASAALSRVDRSCVGVSSYYVPRDLCASVLWSLSGPTISVPRADSSSGTSSTLRQRRRPAEAKASIHSVAIEDAGDAVADPILWFGPLVSRLVSSAQDKFRLALAASIELLAVRSKLFKLLAEMSDLESDAVAGGAL